jgi:hypothetical protein
VHHHLNISCELSCPRTCLAHTLEAIHGRAPQIPASEPPVVPLKPTWATEREGFSVWWAGRREDPSLSSYSGQSSLAGIRDRLDFEEDA